MRTALAAISASDWTNLNVSGVTQRIFAIGSMSDVQLLAESGNLRAQVLMGGVHAGRQEWVQAIEYYHRAAVAGDPHAQFSLAMEYSYGIHVTRNHSEALRLLARSAAQGHVDSQSSLGFMLYLGDPAEPGIPPTQAEGVMWLRRAAAAGSEGAAGFLRVNNIPLQ